MSKFLLILSVLVSANTFASVSKWVDAQGQVHYSDQSPPRDTKAEKLRSTSSTESTAATSAPAAAKSIAEREAELKKTQQAKKEAADKAAQKRAEEESLKSNCAASQQNLKALQGDIRMVELDAKGERSFMSDEKRQQNIAKAQQDISRYCK